MRLLNTLTLKLEEFFEDNIPSYAILSHTWESEEVTFKEMRRSTCQQKKGYQKIKSACEFARNNEFKYIWIDTCCIDKRSSSELSEVINSMYQWYQNSDICYAYLADVSSDDRVEDTASDFRKSRWFTRGWTLQELIAPMHVQFLSREWIFMGTRLLLKRVISEITTIDVRYLINPCLLTEASIATRMSWASNRQCSRGEDTAYCLLGVFDVNMPLLYGEGRVKAFIRLQEEIIKGSDDRSIFVWRDNDLDFVRMESNASFTGIFAASPKWFFETKRAQFSNWEPISQQEAIQPYYNTNQGLFIQVELVHIVEDLFIAGLAISASGASPSPVAILLYRKDRTKHQYIRIRSDILINFDDDLQRRAKVKLIYICAYKGGFEVLWDDLRDDVALFLSRRIPRDAEFESTNTSDT
jgi:hypothetical protein